MINGCLISQSKTTLLYFIMNCRIIILVAERNENQAYLKLNVTVFMASPGLLKSIYQE